MLTDDLDTKKRLQKRYWPGKLLVVHYVKFHLTIYCIASEQSILVTSTVDFSFLKHLANIPIMVVCYCYYFFVQCTVAYSLLQKLDCSCVQSVTCFGTLLQNFPDFLFFSEPRSYSALMEEKFGLDGFVFREVSFVVRTYTCIYLVVHHSGILVIRWPTGHKNLAVLTRWPHLKVLWVRKWLTEIFFGCRAKGSGCIAKVSARQGFTVFTCLGINACHLFHCFSNL